MALDNCIKHPCGAPRGDTPQGLSVTSTEVNVIWGEKKSIQRTEGLNQQQEANQTGCY